MLSLLDLCCYAFAHLKAGLRVGNAGSITKISILYSETGRLLHFTTADPFSQKVLAFTFTLIIGVLSTRWLSGWQIYQDSDRLTVKQNALMIWPLLSPKSCQFSFHFHFCSRCYVHWQADRFCAIRPILPAFTPQTHCINFHINLSVYFHLGGCEPFFKTECFDFHFQV